jgi:hypothetical protein
MYRKSIYLPGCGKLIDNYIWVSLMELGCLVKIEVNTGHLSFVGRFPVEDASYQLYSQINEYENKLIFCPWNTNCISVYDMKIHDFRIVPMKKYNYFGAGRFLSAVQEHECLYFISENAKEIVEFDMRQEMIKDVYPLSEKEFEDDFFGFVMPLRTQKDIWKISEKRGRTWKFNIISKTFEKRELINEDMTIYTGCSSKEDIWMLTENSVLYQFTSDGVYFKEYDLSEILKCKLKKQGEEREFFSSIYLNNNLFFIWYGKKCIIKIPVKDSTVQVKEYQITNYDRASFSFGDKLIVMEDSMTVVIEGEDKKEVIIENSYSFMKDLVKAMDNKLIEKNSSCMELESFISFLDYHTESCTGSNRENTSGNRIYRMMI